MNPKLLLFNTFFSLSPYFKMAGLDKHTNIQCDRDISPDLKIFKKISFENNLYMLYKLLLRIWFIIE